MDNRASQGVIITPMGLGEVLDTGFTLVRRNFRVLAGLVAWAIVPGYVIQSVVGALGEESGLDFLGTVVTSIADWLATIVAVLACSRIIRAGLSGGISALDVYSAAVKRFPGMLLLAAIAFVSLFPLAIVFPLGVYVWVRCSQTISVMLIEERGVADSIRRSWALTRGAWWHTFVTWVVGSLVILVVYVVVGIILGLWNELAEGVLGEALITSLLGATLSTTLSIIVNPISASIGVVLYYELRARVEGFDLEQRMGELGSDPIATATRTTDSSDAIGWRPDR